MCRPSSFFLVGFLYLVLLVVPSSSGPSVSRSSCPRRASGPSECLLLPCRFVVVPVRVPLHYVTDLPRKFVVSLFLFPLLSPYIFVVVNTTTRTVGDSDSLPRETIGERKKDSEFLGINSNFLSFYHSSLEKAVSLSLPPF